MDSPFKGSFKIRTARAEMFTFERKYNFAFYLLTDSTAPFTVSVTSYTMTQVGASGNLKSFDLKEIGTFFI